jgi:hypothetical protein
MTESTRGTFTVTARTVVAAACVAVVVTADTRRLR